MFDAGIEVDDTTMQHRWEMVWIQVAAYALLLVSGLLRFVADWSVWLQVIALLVVLAAFLVHWPFRGSLIDRVISAVFGVLSIAFAVMALGDGSFSAQLAVMRVIESGVEPGAVAYATWASVYVVLLVVLTVLGFARQMFRRQVTHLVRSLSHSLTSSVAAVSLPGWMFLPELLAQLSETSAGGSRFIGMVVVLSIAVVLVVALSACALLWWAQSDPDERVHAPWIGFALLPVLLSGLIVFGAAVVFQM